MSFRNQVLHIYETTANAAWKEDLAHTLFADAVASQLEDWQASEGDDEGHSIAEDLSHEVTRPQEDIRETVKDLAKQESLDLKKYYDIDQIEKMDQALKRTLHVSLEDVYNENETWAHHIVMGFVGMGVSPFDDKEFQSWLQYQSGATRLDWRRHPHFESPYDGAMEFIDQCIQQRKSEEGDEEEATETHASVQTNQQAAYAYNYGFDMDDDDDGEEQ